MMIWPFLGASNWSKDANRGGNEFVAQPRSCSSSNALSLSQGITWPCMGHINLKSLKEVKNGGYFGVDIAFVIQTEDTERERKC